MDLTTKYTPVGYVLFNLSTKKFVGCDSQSGNYPWESDSIQGMTIWRSEKEAIDYKNISGFNRFGSDNWQVKTLYYR